MATIEESPTWGLQFASRVKVVFSDQSECFSPFENLRLLGKNHRKTAVWISKWIFQTRMYTYGLDLFNTSVNIAPFEFPQSHMSS